MKSYSFTIFFYWWNDKTEKYESSMRVFQEGVTGIKRAALRSCWLIPGTKRIHLFKLAAVRTDKREEEKQQHSWLTGWMWRTRNGTAVLWDQLGWLGYHWVFAVLARKQRGDLSMERVHLGLEITQHRGFQTLLSLLCGVLYESQCVKTPSVKWEADLVEAKMEGMCGRSVSRNQGHVCPECHLSACSLSLHIFFLFSYCSS